MKRFFRYIFTSFIFQLLFFFVLTSCENPLFIGITELYEVNFSTNGGSPIESRRTDCIKEIPQTSKNDCSFCGWYTNSAFTGEAVTFPFELNEDTTLYAKWQQMYTVTFATNGGTNLESYKTGIIEKSPDISRADFVFAGWYTTEDFSGSAISFPYMLTRPTTLYAKWIQTSFLVNFETNGGSAIESYKTGVIQTTPETTKENFIFAGWYTTSDFSGEPVIFPYTLTKQTSFYAKWLPTYQASFVTGGGSEISSYRTTKIETAPQSIRYEYSFAGWYMDAEFSQLADFPYLLTSDTIFYAKWQKIYTVKFVTNGGSAVTELKTGYIETEPITTKTDFGFGGWYLDADFTEESRVSFPYTVTDDISLYAKWTAEQCTITYYSNGATGGTVPLSVSVDKGSSYTILGNSGNLEKTGYAFTKWNTKADGNGQGYSAGSSITVTGNVALYAQWGKDYAAMITVPGGFFYFGAPEDEDRPKITLSSFQIAQYEVTYELWLEVATWAKENGYNLTAASKGYATNDQFKSFVPATNISWNMACVWLNAYSAYKGYEPVYYRGNSIWKDDTSTSGTFSWNKTKNGYRLPTECEWEFAAGGGNAETHDQYSYAGSNVIDEVAWYSKNSGNEAQLVGTKKANTLGIYDMSGNVAEWCYDYYSGFGTGELTNPVHESGNYRCVRGGSLLKYDSITKVYKRGYAYEIYDGIYNSHLSTSTVYAHKELSLRPARNTE